MIFVMTGNRTSKQSVTSEVGIGSNVQCFLAEDEMRVETSSSVSCLKPSKVVQPAGSVTSAVPGRAVLRVQPNQLSYCRNLNVRIMFNCSASIGNPTSTNLTFFQNNTEFNRINGSHSGSYSQAAFTRRLNQSSTYLFTCQATNIIGSGPRSNVVTITNKDPPAISNCSNATVMEGDKLVWTCDANGSEPLTTFWYRENNNTVIQSGRHLTIGTVSRADAGMYTFTASNGEECPAANETVYLVVHSVPGRPVLRVQPNQLSYCRNLSVRIMLNCSASIGNPTSTNLTFFKNNTEFNRINGSHSDSYSQAVFSRRLNQSGTYLFTCQATNIIGSGPRSNVVTISNKDPPAISNCLNATVMEGDKLVWTCDASGSEPLTTFWYRENNNTVIQSGRYLTIDTVSRADAGMYGFTASNGEECPAASKTVYLDVHRKKNPPNCTDSTFEVTTGQCVSIQTSANPLPALNCFPKGNIMTSSSGNSYTMCGVKNTTTSICTISNTFGRCSIIIKVHQRVPEYAYKGFFKITNQNFNDNLKYKNSVEYKTLESRIANMLKTVYKSYKYTSTNVIGFWPGSVIVVFQLKLVTNINDPLLPIVEASRKNGGLIAGFQMDSSSIQPGEYTPPPTMTVKTSTTSSPQATFTSHGQSVSTTPCTDSSQVPAIVLGVMFSISLVFNLLFLGYFVWKKRIENKENRNNSSSYKETMYMNNIAFQDQRSNNELQNIEPVISQNQQQPIPPVYQSVQVHTDTYSSLSPKTKLPPKPAVLTNSGDYEDLRSTSHQYQSLDGFSRV